MSVAMLLMRVRRAMLGVVVVVVLVGARVVLGRHHIAALAAELMTVLG